MNDVIQIEPRAMGRLPTGFPTLLAALRARRLARRLVELEERLAANLIAGPQEIDEARRDLRADRHELALRLGRAGARLDRNDALRASIERVCERFEVCQRSDAVDDEREFRVAVEELRGAIRAAGPPTERAY